MNISTNVLKSLEAVVFLYNNIVFHIHSLSCTPSLYLSLFLNIPLSFFLYLTLSLSLSLSLATFFSIFLSLSLPFKPIKTRTHSFPLKQTVYHTQIIIFHSTKHTDIYTHILSISPKPSLGNKGIYPSTIVSYILTVSDSHLIVSSEEVIVIF